VMAGVCLRTLISYATTVLGFGFCVTALSLPIRRALRLEALERTRKALQADDPLE